jgi:hypothetical protein
VNRNTLINKYSLKLADFNKELEYQTQPTEVKVLDSVVYTLCAYAILIFTNFIYEITVKYMHIDGIVVRALIIKGTVIILTIGVVIAIKKVHDMNYQRVLLFFILVINVLVNLELRFSINV